MNYVESHHTISQNGRSCGNVSYLTLDSRLEEEKIIAKTIALDEEECFIIDYDDNNKIIGVEIIDIFGIYKNSKLNFEPLKTLLTSNGYNVEDYNNIFDFLETKYQPKQKRNPRP